jgi:hypothetical protein
MLVCRGASGAGHAIDGDVLIESVSDLKDYDSAARRNSVGDCPVQRLKARAKLL